MLILTKIMIVFTLVSGWASQYAPGVMERVVRVRQSGRTSMDLPVELPDVDGFIAVEDCDRIGDIVYIRREGTEKWYSFLVADCSGHAETTSWMERNNILIEVDYETAVRWDTVGRGIKIELMEIETITIDNGREILYY